VSFSTKSGSVKPSRAATDPHGRAAVVWTPGTRSGEQTLVGMVSSTDVRGSYATEATGTGREPTTKALSTKAVVKTKAVSLKKKGR
jgi:hypothetical protein